MDLSPAEIEAFDGLNQSFIEMVEQQNKVAPRCHFLPMSLESGDGENSVNSWWECSVCSHTKGNF